jgi:mRNA-degrading endonuclease toxin of MazEF toxin-antitoxin module
MKDYKDWMQVKAKINSTSERPKYNEGDIYWMSIGENIGFEQDGKGVKFARPVLIVKGFSRQLVWGVPLTSQPKTGRYYFPLRIKGVESRAILSQLKAIDTARISGARFGVVEDEELQGIKKLLRDLLE